MATLLEGLISWWRLNDATGTSAADSAGSNTGTLTGSQAWTTGQIGGCFDFQESQRFSCGVDNSLNLTAALTIAAWMNTDSVGEGSNGRIFSRVSGATGYELFVTSAASPKLSFFNHADTFYADTTVFTLAVWRHVAVTISGTAYQFYISGSPTGSGTMGAGIASASGATAVLGSRAAGDRDFDGRLDDVRIYNRALPAAEIAYLATWRGLMPSMRNHYRRSRAA